MANLRKILKKLLKKSRGGGRSRQAGWGRQRRKRHRIIKPPEARDIYGDFSGGEDADGGMEWDAVDSSHSWPLHSTRHFYKVTSREFEESRSRRSFIRHLQVRFRNFRDCNTSLESLLVKIFRRLISKAVSDGHKRGYKGKPRWLSVQMVNERMRAPFYTPLRAPDEISAEVVAASLLWLQAQSGDELELFEHPLSVRIQAIWPLRRKL